MIHVTATSAGMLDWDVMIDLALEKTNTPPVITVDIDEFDGSQATWASDQFSFSLSGEVFDPDGGDVVLSANMCGETTTSFTGERPNWDVSLSIAKCVADGLTQYDVVISATDSVGEISMIEVSVANPYSGTVTEPGNTDSSNEEAGLPSIGMFATMFSMLGAAILLRRD